MELLRGTAPKVDFYYPTPDTTVDSVDIVVDGGVGISGTVVDNDDHSTVQLPYLQAANSSVEVTWNFVIDSNPYSETFVYEIVTPYLTKQEIKKIWPTATDEEISDVEAVVRHVINSHTGQSFGYAYKTLSVEGHGEHALRLPERLVKLVTLSTLTATLNTHRAIVVSDGWYLKKGWSDEVTAIENEDQYFLGESLYHQNPAPGEPGFEMEDHGHIIVAPGATGRPTSWRDDYPFRITGWWGYETIPAAVKEAAKLLVNDYACSETVYRDRYLESLKTSDWRFQFSTRSWDYTGNVRADHLLSEFVILPWAVV